MQEIISQALIQLRGAYRYRWYALLAAWIAAVIGWGFVIMMPDTYEARARVFVDTDTVLKPLLNGLAVNTDVTNRVNMMARVILGRPNLERVARETDLSQRAHTPQQMSALVTSLSNRITLESGNGSNIYSIRFTDKDPVMAQRVVQHLLDAFVEDTLGIKHADSGTAQQFLKTQIAEYEQRLHDAEERLADFKRRNVGLMPGQTGDYYTRLQTSLAKLDELHAKLRLTTERRAELNRQISGEEPTFGLFTGSSSGGETSTSGPIDAQIADYKRQLNVLLLQYTEKHPKVIAVQETIAQLEAQKAAEKKAHSKDPPPLPQNRSDAAAMALDINPVYQSLRIEMSHADVELAELKQQIGEEEENVKELRSRVNTIPETEAQLTQLNRDYEVTKTQHQQLLQRLESARLSDQAEASSEPGRFRVIEPVTRPLVPIGPNRLLLMSGVLVAALGLALVLAIGLNQMNPVFLTRAMLGTITGLPVLGAINFVESIGNRPLLRRDPVLLGMAGGGLLLAYVVGVGLANPVSRLLHTWVG
jgi:polysaccharide chain length determinant protein (PEP-CTERM system associated)